MPQFRELDAASVAALFGGTVDEVRQWCGPLLASFDFGYRILEGSERDGCLLEAIRRLDPFRVSVAGTDRKPEWEAGWSENLIEFTASGDLDTLVPKYIRPGEWIRLNGMYVQPRDPHFVKNYTKMFRAWLIGRFLSGYPDLYEFGCGSCSHVAAFAAALPSCHIHGLDWAQASSRIIDELVRRFGWTMSNGQFDFFAPDHSLPLAANSVVLTFGALEQVGDRTGPFLDYLLANQPARCIHVEGLEELYDENHLLDAVALRYHRKRNYLSGLVTRLRQLEQQGQVVIDALHRHRFGTRFDDTFSYIVWSPTKRGAADE